MPALPLLDVPLDAATKLPEHAVIEIGGLKVALLGKKGGRNARKKGTLYSVQPAICHCT